MKYNTSKMTKTITLALLAFTTTFGISQDAENLISNGSFESIDKEPKKLGGIESANGWYSPTGQRADLFTPNKKVPIISAPINQYGQEDAKEGQNYAGVVVYSHNNKIPRSYVSNKLSVPLKKGQKYCVQFYVSLAESSTYGSNNIGAYFTSKALASEDKETINAKPQVMGDGNKVLTAPFGWDKVCNTFVAEGGEKFITIGNFSTNDNTKTLKIKKNTANKAVPVPAAYYYIDHISVTLVDETNKCDCVQQDPTEGFSKTIYQKAVTLKDNWTPAQTVEAQQLFFAFGKADFTSASEESLDFIVKVMKANPDMKLQINGHSDDAEDKVGEDNPFFSEMDSKRIAAVYNYLVEKGIAEGRLMADQKGHGEASPDITSTDEEDIMQAKNRRVSFKVR